MAKRSADHNPISGSPSGDGKRRKLDEKEHLSCLERETDLKKKLDEAKATAEFYKAKCESNNNLLEEFRQRRDDLHQELRRAKRKAVQYHREARLTDDYLRFAFEMDLPEIYLPPAAAADEEFPNRKEVVFCSDTGYPIEMCQRCGEEEACIVLLPCKHLCLCMSCESETDRCPHCHSTKTGSFWTDVSKNFVDE